MIITKDEYCYECGKMHPRFVFNNKGIAMCPNKKMAPMEITISKLRAKIEKEQYINNKNK